MDDAERTLNNMETTLSFLREAVQELGEDQKVSQRGIEERARLLASGIANIDKNVATVTGTVATLDEKVDGHIEQDRQSFAMLWRLLGGLGVLGAGGAGASKFFGG